MRYLVVLIALFFVLYSCKSSKSTYTITKNPSGNKSLAKALTVPASGKNAEDVIHSAKKYLGTPYKYSGMDRSGMDCSGLICQAFNDVGVNLPHQSAEQSKLGKSVSLKDLKPGDLIFLGATKGSDKITHVGMVVKVDNGKIIFIHSSTKKGVIEENLLEKWYQPLFIKGARLF
ncbi:MAG: C40 family peptidase [Opitutaceae bacterium]|nr:C40 family peptidase [Cytophagales bacterium]